MAAERRPDGGGGRMPLRAHLRELRRRAFRIALGILVGMVAGWLAYRPVFEALTRPLERAAAERHDVVAVNFSGLTASFDMQVQVSVFLAVLLSSPWWIYQLWAFVTPGLTSHERRYAVGFLAAAVPLFLAGALVAWWALPRAVEMLTGFTPAGAQNLIDAPTYLSFVLRVVLAFGIAFLVPVLVVALDLVGVVRARFWLRAWRWAVVVVFAFAAVATPTPDAVTMLFVALPMCALYFGAVGACAVHDRRLERRRAAQAAGLPEIVPSTGRGTAPSEPGRVG